MSLYSIVSGSMAPAIGVGELVFVKPVSQFSDIKTGDMITFVVNKHLTVATHRVVGINEKEETLETKGDANETKDANPVSYENVVGKVVWHLPYLGYVNTIAGNTKGKVMLICLLSLLFLIGNLLDEKKEGVKHEALDP
jgi:signal peptidase I